MYLAPINYDRFFERIFRDVNVAKKFLEDLLNVEIETIQYLPRKNKITDDAAFIEFDFRCKINGKFVIIDMQQWYKKDVVKRFFMYFCNNTTLQLEHIPPMSVPVPGEKEYKTKDYSFLQPNITIVWMVDDSLGFTDDMISFSMLPEMIIDFIRDEKLWQSDDYAELFKKHAELIKKLNINKKGLDFLRENRLIFAFQPNIVKNQALMNQALMAKYYPWFDFAQRTRNANNTKEDFESFTKIPIFMDIMEKLMVSTLPQDDFQYITDYAAYERRLAVYNSKIHDEGYQQAWSDASMKYEPVIEMQSFKIKQVEQEKQKAEQEKQKAEQEKQKAEQALFETRLHLVKKMLKKGDSEEEIIEFLEIDLLIFELLLKKIKESETDGASIVSDKKDTN